MKFISWNVNGLKACIDKGFKEFFCETEADFFVFKKPKSVTAILKLSWKIMTNTGLTVKEKVILEQLLLQSISLLM